MRSKESFRAQFSRPIITEGELYDKFLAILRLEDVIHGYPIYRALEKLVLLDTDGKYYMA